MKFNKNVASGAGVLIETAQSFLENLGRWIGLRASATQPAVIRQHVLAPVPLVWASIDDVAKVSRRRHTLQEIEVRRRDFTTWDVDLDHTMRS
jgi:hypothetical protein